MKLDVQGHLTQHKLYLDPFMDIFSMEKSSAIK